MKKINKQTVDRIMAQGGQVRLYGKDKQETRQPPSKAKSLPITLGPAKDLQDIHGALQDQGDHLEQLVELLTKIASEKASNPLNITIEVIERDDYGHIKTLNLRSHQPMTH